MQWFKELHFAAKKRLEIHTTIKQKEETNLDGNNFEHKKILAIEKKQFFNPNHNPAFLVVRPLKKENFLRITLVGTLKDSLYG